MITPPLLLKLLIISHHHGTKPSFTEAFYDETPTSLSGLMTRYPSMLWTADFALGQQMFSVKGL